MFKFLGNKWFIIILFFGFAIFAISVIIDTSDNGGFLYHDENKDPFDIIDTLD